MPSIQNKSLSSPDETRTPDKTRYAISGRIGVSNSDGAKGELGAGDAYQLAPGHDAWVIGDEPFVGVEFKSAAGYAKG